jgi:hypothetical protein
LIRQQSEGILYINAPFVKTTMTYHSPRVMVATGPPGDPIAIWLGRQREAMAKRNPGTENAGIS